MSSVLECNPVDNLDSVNQVLESYLDELDLWQREVDNIRIMHHEVWKGSRLSPLIKQHRAGSRVEKQTRILPIGGQTDVDYMFEVVGAQVLCNGTQDFIYFKSCSRQNSDIDTKYDTSSSFGRIYVSEAYKAYLEGHEMYGKIFAEAMSFDQTENAFLLIPGRFKENVVQNCGLDYTRNEALPSTISPSISGQGAMNEYDGVPCLKLASWPREALSWIHRQNRSDAIFQNEWKSEVVKNIPLFLVPTGNPTSKEQDMQFRLSFSMVEIACFKKMTAPMRKLYGIVKYVFKTLFHESGLLSSYHLKTLMLWKIDQTPAEEWTSKKATEFIIEMMEDVYQALNDANIPHFFVENCNIFPVHKITDENVLEYAKIFQNIPCRLQVILGNLLRQDLGVPSSERWLSLAMVKLKSSRQTRLEAYIDGYLTRLLSVITFSLTENFMQTRQQGEASWEEMERIFAKYDHDHHISRIIDMVNSCICRLEPSSRVIRSRITPEHSSCKADEMSRLVHEAFEAYTKGSFSTAMEYIRHADLLPQSCHKTLEGRACIGYAHRKAAVAQWKSIGAQSPKA
ncbi:Protein MB21D2 [Stylophora pistillata]|uniref:Protein MB21D2 n=1 Tax=Stylophora pistillata TaxID=50429 RepID=A0A2B4RB57_STYPI|nr:Protein MB21D2 [Stylophora pistillata]